jgi:pimeloyl-ACP methyl ester carboxylesterase
MAFTQINNQIISYRLLGNGEKPLLVAGHPLGMNQSVWDPLIPYLLPHFDLLTWDLPGHGASQGVIGKAIDQHQLAEQVLALVDLTPHRTFYYVGTSIGGVIGQALMHEHPARLLGTLLTNTGAKLGTPEAWNNRAEQIREKGLATMAPEIVPRWFANASVTSEPSLINGWVISMGRGDAESYAQLSELLGRFDAQAMPFTGAFPTRLAAGEDDPATPLTTMQGLQKSLGGQVELTIIPKAGHVPSIETPRAFASLIKDTFNVV